EKGLLGKGTLTTKAVHDRRHCTAWPAAGAIIIVALVVGVALRIVLAIVNLEANDPHLPVIRAIAFEHRFPTRKEGGEGFQPKLYHTTVAILWLLLPTRAPSALTRSAQLVSCAAGVLTLLIVLRFLGLLREEAGRAKSGHAPIAPTVAPLGE